MKRFLAGLFLLGIALAGIVGFYGYSSVFGKKVLPNKEDQILLIKTGSQFSDVKQQLVAEGIITDVFAFEWISKLMKYGPGKVPAGRYLIKQNSSHRDLIGLLRSGNQEPINITFNNVRTLADLAGRVAEYLESDSLLMINYLSSSEALEISKLTPETFLTLFIPNTYQMFWTTTPEVFLRRMINENERFWQNQDRLARAEKLGLSKEEVYTLASIVEKESLLKSEQPIIAGVYLNRLKRGMLLQADPTVVFAVGDFTIRRVLNKHLEIESPYNTYKFPGLPPGPIYMPSISAIDAVLNYSDHKYLYFCANPANDGSHLFATNLAEHNRNARAYQSWLNRNGIK